MNPFYFGSSEQPLYGVHHPPRSQGVRDAGVVLCYPMGQEYMRAHRAFRQLAMLLTRAGFNVLRFDYSGTGDSGGRSEDGDVGQWVRDVAIAAEELKEMASVSRISLVGLRLGAALAAAAAESRDDVEHLVLWDPILSGPEYETELLRHVPVGAATGDREVGVLGFPLTSRMRAGLAELDLGAVRSPAGSRVLIVGSAEHREYERLRGDFARSARSAALHVIPTPGSWGEVDNFGSALIPQAIIQAIVVYLSGESAR